MTTFAVVGNNDLGGTGKFLFELSKYIDFIRIRNKSELSKVDKKIILLIQQLTHTDITCDDIIKTECVYYINIHDFCWLNPMINYVYSEIEYHSIYLTRTYLRSDVISLFARAKNVLFPSMFILNEYKKRINFSNYLLVPNPDEKIICKIKLIKVIRNINIGICHSLTICKGRQLINFLRAKISNFANCRVNFIEVEYDETNFFEKIKLKNIHGLLALNVWGESYCYALTKFLNSGLPIIYNNIGSFRERIPQNSHFFQVFDYEKDISCSNFLIRRFREFLNYIFEGKFESFEHRTNNFFLFDYKSSRSSTELSDVSLLYSASEL